MLDVLGISRDLLEVFDIAVLFEVSCQVFELVNGVVEVFLVGLHLLNEFFFLLFQETLLFADAGDGFDWSAIYSPHFVITFLIGEFVMEPVKNRIDVHAFLDIDLFLFHFAGELIHDLFDLRKLFNVLWNLLDLDIVFVELSKQFI